MHLSLIERLNAARYRRFVGRKQECNLFKSVLEAKDLPFSVLHIFGPGGVGKTTLLWEFDRICKSAQIPALYLDARNIEPTSDAFLNARLAINLTPTAGTIQALTSEESRYVLLIDSYEMLAPLDDWLREVFLPQLPEHALIVLAGRRPPSAAWRTDPGWQALLHSIALGNLSHEESQLYLTQQQIPGVHHQAILNFTHGHPLALSLVADGFVPGQEIDIQPEATPDVVKTLLEKFLEEVPSPTHRMALEACAVVRLMTEALLAEMLDRPDVHELFEWLRGLSFIESGRLGVFPHDLVRDVLMADLRWRHPDWYAKLYQRARGYYVTRLEQTLGQEHHQILFDCVFLHRSQSAVREGFTWQESSNLLTDSLREDDRPTVLAMVEEYEGEEAAHLAAHWLDRQPHNVLVFRDAEQQVAGLIIAVALHQATSDEIDRDPATRTAWQALQNRAPLRSGEGAILYRFWMARETYQRVSPTQSLIFVNFIQHFRSIPATAFTFIACAEPEDWAALFGYADLMRIPEADFEVAGQRYGIYGHDWRVMPSTVWRELMAQRGVAASIQDIAAPAPPDPPVILSEPEFMEAVQDALRYFARPEALYDNPLLRSRLILEQVATQDDGDRVTALRAWLQKATESLQSSPRDEKLYRVLYRTYLQPAPTQERAAESLNLPFSTYRRHLKTGVARVAKILWQEEIRNYF